VEIVELAIVMPLLLLVLFGIIEFGAVFNNYVQLRSGVRNAARQGAVASYSTTSCSLNFGTGSTNPGAGDVKNLMCEVQNSVAGGGLGMGAGQVAVMVAFAPPGLNGANLAGTANAQVGNGLVVCAQYPLTSLTGLFAPYLNGHIIEAKTVIRIEVAGSGTNDGTGAESPPTGGTWSWCNATTSGP